MDLPPLYKGTLIKRYKRFLADIELETGEVTTAHCPNSGKMLGAASPGMPVYISKSDNPTRKLAYTLEMVVADGILTGVNTGNANRIVKEGLQLQHFPMLSGYDTIKPEAKYGRSRIDFLLTKKEEQCWVEVKNCHLKRQDSLLEFPDAITSRGVKHLEELIGIKQAGHRAVMLYLGQRSDCERFTIAADLDPAYANALEKAVKAGVEAYCFTCYLSEQAIAVNKEIPIVI